MVKVLSWEEKKNISKLLDKGLSCSEVVKEVGGKTTKGQVAAVKAWKTMGINYDKKSKKSAEKLIATLRVTLEELSAAL